MDRPWHCRVHSGPNFDVGVRNLSGMLRCFWLLSDGLGPSLKWILWLVDTTLGHFVNHNAFRVGSEQCMEPLISPVHTGCQVVRHTLIMWLLLDYKCIK